MAEIYDQPKVYTEPLFNTAPEQDINQTVQPMPEMEVDMGAVREGIMAFQGDDIEYAKDLINHRISGQYGQVPKQSDYASNMMAYFDDEELDPIQVIKLLQAEFKPEEDKSYTELKDYEALTPEEQWNKIKPAPMAGGNVAIGATMPAMIPQKYKRPQEVFFSESEKKKNINDHINELKSKSRTWKLEQGRGFSEAAKAVARKIAITKQQLTDTEKGKLTSQELAILPIYLSGLNPTKSTEAWGDYVGAVAGTSVQAVKDVLGSFEETGNQLFLGMAGVDDPEELYLRFKSKFKDKFDINKIDKLSRSDKSEIRDWITKQVTGFTPAFIEQLPPSPLNQQFMNDSLPRIDKIIKDLDIKLQTGKEFRDKERLEKRISQATRDLYDSSGFKGLTLSSIPIAADLAGAVATSLAGTAVGGPTGGSAGLFTYTSGRMYGDLVNEIIEAGGDPQEARAIGGAAMIPVAMLEKWGIDKLVPQASFKEFSAQFIKAFKEWNLKEFGKGVALKGGALQKDFIYTYLPEVGIETLQEGVLTAAKKASSEADFDDTELMNNLISTFKEAAKGMFLISAAGTGVRGLTGVKSDFNQINQAEAIEDTFDPLTTQEQDLAALEKFRREEYEAAEDKEAYLAEQDFTPSEREFIGVAQDIRQEEIQRRLEDVDLREAREDITTLEDRAAEFKPHANIVEEGNGIRVTTHAGIDFRLEFQEDLETAGEYDPTIATIKLNPNTGQPTTAHEKVHLFKNIGLITDKEFNNLQAKAEEYFGKDEVNRIREENIKGYAKKGRVATEEILSEEIVANYFEDLSLKKDIPEDVRNIFQKILDYIKESLKQYIETSVSGDKMIKLIQSGEIIKRKPIRNGAKKMQRAAKRREEAQAALEKLEQIDLVDNTDKKFSIAPRTVKSLENKWTKKGVDLFIVDKKDEIKLNHISVDKDKRGAGIGSQIMNELVNIADRKNKTIRLTLATQDKNFGTTSRKRLVKFYKQFGFVENKGRNKDFKYNHDEMYRHPSQDSETKFSIAPREDSKAFKDMFGDTKVVDENGDPLVVYHGTESIFTEFKKDFIGKTDDGYFGKGFYFSNSYTTAMQASRDTGNIISAYIKMENPFYIDMDLNIYEQIKNLPLKPETIESIQESVDLYGDEAFLEGLESWSDDITKSIKTAGHDGVYISNRIDDDYLEFVVFEPNQIKSATENVGTYDLANPDIRYSLSPRSERDAVTVLANAIVTGKAKTLAQREQILNSYKIPLENQAAIKERAFDIAEQVQSEIDSLENTQTIRNAIRKAEIKQFYDAERKAILEKGIEQGELLEMAKQRLRENRRQEREATGKNIVTPKQNDHNEYFLTDPENVDDRLKEIGEDIKQALIRAGVFTKRKKKFENEIQYKVAYSNALASILNNYIHTKIPAGHKRVLFDKVRDLRSVRRLDTLENRFKNILSDAQTKQVKLSKDELIKKWNKTLNQRMVKERDSSRKELIHSKVKKTDKGIQVKDLEPMVRRRLKLIKQVAKVSESKKDDITSRLIDFINDPSNIDFDKTDAFIKSLEDDFSAFKQYRHLEPVDRAKILTDSLMKYGGLKEKSVTEMAEALSTIEDDIKQSIKRLEDLLEEKNKRIQPQRDAIEALKGKRRSELGQKVDRFISMSFSMRSFFQDILRVAPQDKQDKAKDYLDQLLEDWNHAIHKRDLAIAESQKSIVKAIGDIYGVKDTWAKLASMSKTKKEYSKFSKFGDRLSKFQVMQLYASATQLDYINNAQENNRQASQYEEVLTPEDTKLLDWFRDYYAKERGALSTQLEKMTGIPIEMLDPNYVPVKIESEQGGLGTEINATAIIPPGMIKRVNHKLDFDEQASIFEIWMTKVEENEHFKHTADVAVDMRSIFGSSKVQKSIIHNYGKSFTNNFLNMLKDNINNQGYSNLTIPVLDKLRGAWTASKFGLNARIGIKQITSIPAFGLEIGLMRTGKYLTEAPSSEGRKAMWEIANSPLMKERIGSGNTEATKNALGGGLNTKWSKFVKSSMIFNITGDMLPTMIIGQGIYRSYTKQYYENGATIEEAKEKAMSKLFQIAESTQQSSKLKDWAEWQRRGGSLGKMAAQFTNTTRQFLERDFTDIRAFLADPKNSVRQKTAANTLFINHILLPAFYNGMNMLINMILGDDIDEDDWWMLVTSMLLGPASGFIVFGAITTGITQAAMGQKKFGGNSLTPFAGIIEDTQQATLVTKGILTADEEMLNDAIEKLLKSLVAPYREIDKYNKNNQ